MGNSHFFNKEDAQRHASNFGGKVIDNTHNNNPWVGNNYTVAGDSLSNVPNFIGDELEFFGYVEMTKEQHEAWMLKKGWSQEIRERHAKEFRGSMEFDDNGSFEYL
ncbi:hypothetical protein [Sphingobacterium sp. UBA6320]|uniref:hypothetical protein n=1 Tax=Sphingobacterium sp. UBA6320 TaxID=1947510 RepID=UPI0025ECBD42|nr:hypothetical protein [Sphingobacterium sp. UBA6320]